MAEQPVPEDFQSGVEGREALWAALPEAARAHIAAKDVLLERRASRACRRSS